MTAETAMESDLQTLEDRVNTLAMLCQQLRKENSELRQHAVTLKNENRRLSDKVDGAKARVETLLAQLPAPSTEEESE